MKRYSYIKIIILFILFALILIQLYELKSNQKIIAKPNIDIEEDNNTNENIQTSDNEEKHIIATPSNPDIIGSIKIEGTNIDEYILQTTNNEYYLNHNINKEYDIVGSVFMDYRNNINDKKILIFGHSAKSLETVPFYDLKKYIDKNFYDNHRYINLKFNDEESKWIIFSVMVVKKGDNTHMRLEFDDNSWNEHINYIKNNSIYDTSVDVNGNDNIIIIQTCNYNPENTYILLCAKKIQ